MKVTDVETSVTRDHREADRKRIGARSTVSAVILFRSEKPMPASTGEEHLFYAQRPAAPKVLRRW